MFRSGKLSVPASADDYIDQHIGQRAYNQRGNDVNKGVLLDEQGGGGDQQAPDHGACAPGPCLHARRMENGKHRRHHAHHMYAGEHIGVGVDGVGVLHHPGENVVPLHHRRAQILPVGNEGADQGADGKGEHDRPHIAAEALTVLDDEIDAQRRQNGTPCYIKKREILAKRNVVVNGRLRGPVIVGNKVLDGKEYGEIYGQKCAPPRMGVGLKKMLDGLHGSSFGKCKKSNLTVL